MASSRCLYQERPPRMSLGTAGPERSKPRRTRRSSRLPKESATQSLALRRRWGPCHSVPATRARTPPTCEAPPLHATGRCPRERRGKLRLLQGAAWGLCPRGARCARKKRPMVCHAMSFTLSTVNVDRSIKRSTINEVPRYTFMQGIVYALYSFPTPGPALRRSPCLHISRRSTQRRCPRRDRWTPWSSRQVIPGTRARLDQKYRQPHSRSRSSCHLLLLPGIPCSRSAGRPLRNAPRAPSEDEKASRSALEQNPRLQTLTAELAEHETIKVLSFQNGETGQCSESRKRASDVNACALRGEARRRVAAKRCMVLEEREGHRIWSGGPPLSIFHLREYFLSNISRQPVHSKDPPLWGDEVSRRKWSASSNHLADSSGKFEHTFGETDVMTWDVILTSLPLFVTCARPFRDYSCQFVDGPKNV